MRALAVDTFRALRCDGLARVDFFYEMDDAGNGARLPLQRGQHDARASRPISMFPKMWIAPGMTYSEIIDRLVDLALERHAPPTPQHQTH